MKRNENNSQDKYCQISAKNTIAHDRINCNLASIIVSLTGKWYNLLQYMSLRRRLAMGTLPFFDNPLVILNPAANRGKMDTYRTLVLDRVKREQARYVETTKRGEAKELAMIAAKEGYPVIIVGGD